MKKGRILSVIMTVLVILSMLPSMAFAAAVPTGAMDGKLKIKGLAAVGVTLSADYEKVQPEGLTDDYVKFQWSRKNGEELTEISTEKTYKVTEEDLGLEIVLKITGMEELGVSGSLTVTSNAVTATEEEAQALVDAAAEAEAETEELPDDVTDMEGIPQNMDTSDMDEFPSGDPSSDGDSGVPPVDIEEIPFDEPMDGPSAGDVSQTHTYTASASTADGSGVLDFGSMTAEEVASVAAQYVTIHNTGTGTLNFVEMSPEHFMVADIGTLGPEESTDVWVQPREGLAPGSYSDVIEYISEEGASASFQAVVTIKEASEPQNTEDTETEDDGDTESPEGGTDSEENESSSSNSVVYDITAEPAQLVFDELTAGYGAETLEPKTVKIMNTGNAEVTLAEPLAENFDIVLQGETNVLAPTEEAIYSVTPKIGLGVSSYVETIAFGIQESMDVSVSASASVTVAEAPEPSVKEIGLSQTSADFGTSEAGYETLPAAAEIIVSNTGNTTVVLAQPQGTSFSGTLAQTELAEGEQTTLSILPNPGLEAGNYSEEIQLYEAGENGGLMGSVTVSFAVTQKKDFSYTAAPESLDFGSMEEGYKVPEAKTVTITNTGNQTLVLADINKSSKAFKAGSLSSKSVEAGGTITFRVQPAAGLTAGYYADTLTIVTEAGIQKEISLAFNVTEAVNKITAVHRAGEIKNLPNASAKTAEGLGLPATVVIETTKGKMEATVTWNVEGCKYNPDSVEAQTFEVAGKVSLPDGVSNPDGIKLATVAKVSVKAYVPKIPDASETLVTGIRSDGDYNTESKITITAVGGGMDNENPRKGDIRYVPANWKVLEARNWDGVPYTATFRMNKGGDYTLTVTFNEQKYDGSQWTKTGQQATRQVNFRVKQLNTVSPTPTPTAQQRNAVKTGDNTMILPFVIILAAAAVCIAGVVIYRRQKK